MHFVLAVILTATALGCSPPSDLVHSIVLDGEFDDWRAVPVSLRDGSDAPGSAVDFGEIRLTADARYFFGSVECRQPIDLDNLEELGTLSIVLDADGSKATGQTRFGLPGVDLLVDLSPGGSGVLIRSFSATGGEVQEHRPETIGLRIAPGYATTRFEFRVDRGTIRPSREPDRLLVSSTALVKLVFQERVKEMLSGPQPGGLQLRDETEVASVSLPPWVPLKQFAADERVPAADPLERGAGGELRVMAWNVGHFPEPARDRAAAVLRAIDADVLLLDELGDDVASALEARLKSSAESRAAWRLTWGHGTGVVARGDVRKTIGKIAYPPGSLERVVDAVAPNQSAEQRRAVGAALDARGVTALGAVATLGARRLLAVTLGIQCCGGAAREERRMIEVRAIHDATRTALASDRPDAVLVGGDFNLVGTRNPLDTLATGLDRDGSSLAIVRALTLDGRASDTWRSARDRFTPGRLDWLMYSDSTLEVVKAFVFDSQDLTPYWLSRHNLSADDSLRTSDHLPVVADFRWKR